MIGDGWAGEPATRPGPDEPAETPTRRVLVATGTRAEFGLLAPVMRAIEAHPHLELLVVAAGSHLVGSNLPGGSLTVNDVRASFDLADAVPMQVAGRTGRAQDVQALGVGVGRFGRAIERLDPDWVVVLGDRIEAFAAAIAASVGGRALAHLHGGDRAAGIADESMRHAIAKLAHLHLPATARSAARLERMGEDPGLIHVVGSPAIDDLASIEPIDDELFTQLGSPDIVVLMHPVGRHREEEEQAATAVLQAVGARRVLALAPNLDAGREGIVSAIASAGVPTRDHLVRAHFVGLLKRLARDGGVLVGNSSAGLIEAAAVRLPTVDVGQRQQGRERPNNVVRVDREDAGAIARGIDSALALDRSTLTHPYGDGHAGQRTARALAHADPHSISMLRKCNTY